jgi:hypothetical protein
MLRRFSILALLGSLSGALGAWLMGDFSAPTTSAAAPFVLQPKAAAPPNTTPLASSALLAELTSFWEPLQKLRRLGLVALEETYAAAKEMPSMAGRKAAMDLLVAVLVEIDPVGAMEPLQMLDLSLAIQLGEFWGRADFSATASALLENSKRWEQNVYEAMAKGMASAHPEEFLT